jgi:3'(2'), 5'-bisphosphate nucleotidase
VSLNITIDMLDKLGVLAKQAGVEIMKIYNSDFKVDTKADNSPVTEADQIAETMITEYIKSNITDAFPIIGEEAVTAGTAPELDGGPFWLIDALDGTKEFINKSKEFTVNIALIDVNRPALGIVHAPALNATYWGSQMGCYAQTSGQGEPRPATARKPTADGMVALVSKSHKTPEIDEYLSKYTIKKEVASGSSLKFCRIATGHADIYPRLGRTMEWDTAAGHAVLYYAGGKVRDLDGKILPYGKPGFENPHFVATGAE